MGGDFAPAAPVAAALLALSELDTEHRVQLIGRESVLREQLHAHLNAEHAALAPQVSRIDFIDAPDVIDMADKLGMSDAVELLEQTLEEEEATLNKLKAIASEFDVEDEGETVDEEDEETTTSRR